MIKASVRMGGNAGGLLVLGITRKTVATLFAGKSVSVDVMGPRGKTGVVLLVAGETEEAIEAELGGALGPDARIERCEP